MFGVEVIVPIFICVILPVSIVLIIGLVRRNETNRKAEVMLKAIENGVPVDLEQLNPKKKSKSIKQGIMGIGFLTLGILRTQSWEFGRNMFLNKFWLPAGAVLLAVGIGLLISYLTGKKMLAKELEAEEKELTENK